MLSCQTDKNDTHVTLKRHSRDTHAPLATHVRGAVGTPNRRRYLCHVDFCISARRELERNTAFVSFSDRCGGCLPSDSRLSVALACQGGWSPSTPRGPSRPKALAARRVFGYTLGPRCSLIPQDSDWSHKKVETTMRSEIRGAACTIDVELEVHNFPEIFHGSYVCGGDYSWLTQVQYLPTRLIAQP